MCAQLEGFNAIRNTYSNDEDFGETWKLSTKSHHKDYVIKDNFFFLRTQLCIPKYSLRGHIIQELYSGGL